MSVFLIVDNENLFADRRAWFDLGQRKKDVLRTEAPPQVRPSGTYQPWSCGCIPIGPEINGMRDLYGHILPRAASLEEDYVAIDNCETGDLRCRFPRIQLAQTVIGIIPAIARHIIC